MRILITAGPTREYLDSVRYLSNASTGKMGYAIAASAVARGHDVILITGPVELDPPERVQTVPVVSAQEMLEAATEQFKKCQAAVMSAAVSDYRPVDRGPRKQVKKKMALDLRLEPTVDICARLGAIKGDRVVVGFALEDHGHRAHAEAKLISKHCDAIVMNHITTIGADSVEIEVVGPGPVWSGPFSGSKSQISGQIVDLVENLHHSG